MDRRTASIVTLTFATLLGIPLLSIGPAGAADCGGANLCFCGDTVIADRTLQCGIDPVTVGLCPETGLNVAPGVALNLGGCTIRGSETSQNGVHLLAADGAPGVGASVTNARIPGFDNGLHGVSLQAIDVSLLQVLGSRSHGITLGDHFGLELRNSTIERNVAVGNGGAGVVVIGGRNVVQLNRAESNGGLGFSVEITGERGVQGNFISRNIARRNAAGGFFIEDVGRRFDDVQPTATLNRAEFNGGDGFVFQGEGFFVSRNVSDRNQGEADGFDLQASTSLVTDNRLTNNPGFGIRILGAGNTYEGNVCRNNGLGSSSVPGLAC